MRMHFQGNKTQETTREDASKEHPRNKSRCYSNEARFSFMEALSMESRQTPPQGLGAKNHPYNDPRTAEISEYENIECMSLYNFQAKTRCRSWLCSFRSWQWLLQNISISRFSLFQIWRPFCVSYFECRVTFRHRTCLSKHYWWMIMNFEGIASISSPTDLGVAQRPTPNPKLAHFRRPTAACNSPISLGVVRVCGNTLIGITRHGKLGDTGEIRASQILSNEQDRFHRVWKSRQIGISENRNNLDPKWSFGSPR